MKFKHKGLEEDLNPKYSIQYTKLKSGANPDQWRILLNWESGRITQYFYNDIKEFTQDLTLLMNDTRA